MRTLVKTAVALSFISAAAVGASTTGWAQGVYFDAPGLHVGVGNPYHHRRYYNYYGGGGFRTWNWMSARLDCPGWRV